MFDAIEAAVRDRQPTYPPEQSAAGINTFTVKGCKVVGHTPGYCVCLNKIKAYERDKALTSYPECERAISSKVCPALDMRREEQAAGKALYFIDRTLLREEMDKTFAASSASFRPSKAVPVTPSKPTPAAPKPKADTSPMSAPEEDGYAAAINAAIKEAATQPAEPIPEPKVVSPSPSPVKQGLSMVERTRLQMGLSKE
jgi:hypothetical protein